MKTTLLFTFIFLLIGCNSELADLSPIKRTPIHLETKDAGTFNKMMLWATNGSHSFARVYTSAPVLDEEVPKGRYDFYAMTLDAGLFMQKCAKWSQNLSGKSNRIVLNFDAETCRASEFIGPEPTVDLNTSPAPPASFTALEFCDQIGSITDTDDQCTDDLSNNERKAGKGYAVSFRMSLMAYENGPTDPSARIALTNTCDTFNKQGATPLRGRHSGTLLQPLLPGNESTPFFSRFEIFFGSGCSGAPTVIDLHHGLLKGTPRTKLVTKAGSPGAKAFYVKVTGEDLCRDERLELEFAGGDGQTAHPYLICTATQLRNIFPANPALYSTYARKNYKLLANIDLTNEPVTGGGFNPPWSACVDAGSNFMPIGFNQDCSKDSIPNSSSFDGGGHEIKGLKIKASTRNSVGLFAEIDGSGTGEGEIRRLKLTNSEISGASYIGTILGRGIKAKIRAVRLENSKVTGSGQFVGGFLGDGDEVYVGDLFSDELKVSGAANVGGVTGNSVKSTHQKIALKGAVSGTGDNVGGIIGRANTGGPVLATVLKVGFVGLVTGRQHVGGVIGMGSKLFIKNNYFRGTLKSTYTAESNTGGIVGYLTLKDSTAGIYTSYSIPTFDIACVLGVSCKVGPIAGHHDGSYTQSVFNTSVYPSTVVKVPQVGPLGVAQDPDSFLWADPMWIGVAPFDSLTWHFQNGEYPKFVFE